MSIRSKLGTRTGKTVIGVTTAAMIAAGGFLGVSMAANAATPAPTVQSYDPVAAEVVSLPLIQNRVQVVQAKAAQAAAAQAAADALAAQQAADAAAAQAAQDQAAADAAAQQNESSSNEPSSQDNTASAPAEPAGTPVPWVDQSADPNNSNGGYFDTTQCPSGSASTINGVPTCD